MWSWIIISQKKIIDNKMNLEDIRKYEKKIYSQYGEDGIIEYIFSQIGFTNKISVEIGVSSDIHVCNSINLVKNHEFFGFFIDKDKNFSLESQIFFKEKNVKLINAFITQNNANNIFLDNNIPDNIDFLSLDIDGNDFYILKAMNTIKFRVMVIEYNAYLGRDLSIVIKYDENFTIDPTSRYYGASILAFAKLTKELGYFLIGSVSEGANLFFVSNEFKDKFKELTIEECWMKPVLFEQRHLELLKKNEFVII